MPQYRITSGSFRLDDAGTLAHEGDEIELAPDVAARFSDRLTLVGPGAEASVAPSAGHDDQPA